MGTVGGRRGLDGGGGPDTHEGPGMGEFGPGWVWEFSGRRVNRKGLGRVMVGEEGAGEECGWVAE